MKIRSYHKEVEKATAQILDCFNNITIERSDETGIQKTIAVPCVYGNRSRVLKSLENRNKTIKLPMLCISMGSLTRDKTRVFGTHDGLFYKNGTNAYLKNMPIPVNIEYSLYMIGKYQTDIDQLISNFTVWFNPDIFVVIPHPLEAGKNIKCQLLWNGNISMTYPEELAAENPARIIATTNFTFKTWLFPGLDGNSYTGKSIHRINFNPQIWNDENEQIGRLQGFYAVPNNLTFDTFQENLLCGWIDSKYCCDMGWQLSAGISGTWMDISALVTGAFEGNLALSGEDMCFLTMSDYDSNVGILLMSKQCYIPSSISGLTIDAYLDYYYSCLTGSLSGYNGVDQYSTI